MSFSTQSYFCWKAVVVVVLVAYPDCGRRLFSCCCTRRRCGHYCRLGVVDPRGSSCTAVWHILKLLLGGGWHRLMFCCSITYGVVGCHPKVDGRSLAQNLHRWLQHLGSCLYRLVLLLFDLQCNRIDLLAKSKPILISISKNNQEQQIDRRWNAIFLWWLRNKCIYNNCNRQP